MGVTFILYIFVVALIYKIIVKVVVPPLLCAKKALWNLSDEAEAQRLEKIHQDDYTDYVCKMLITEGYENVHRVKGDMDTILSTSEKGNRMWYCRNFKYCVFETKDIDKLEDKAVKYNAIEKTLITCCGVTNAAKRHAEELGIKIYNNNWLVENKRDVFWRKRVTPKAIELTKSEKRQLAKFGKSKPIPQPTNGQWFILIGILCAIYLVILCFVAKSFYEKQMAKQQVPESETVVMLTSSVEAEPVFEEEIQTEENPVEEAAETETLQTYVIQKGDTLSFIAKKLNTTVDELLSMNPRIEDKNKIYPGEVIYY